MKLKFICVKFIHFRTNYKYFLTKNLMTEFSPSPSVLQRFVTSPGKLLTLKNVWFLKLSWQRSASYRNQSIDLLWKSVDWFRYDRDLCHERVKVLMLMLMIKNSCSSYSGPHFPSFGLNTEIYGVSLRIQPECGKMRTRITLKFSISYTLFKKQFTGALNSLALNILQNV